MTASAETNPVGRDRIASIDMLRGLVLAIMALDHVRDMISSPLSRDYETAAKFGGPVAALFFTRWITHICAPAFFFLAGVSAFLYGATRQRSKAEVARFLAVRGAWLVLIELTAVNFAWSFNLHAMLILQVIWALGWSMIVLSGLIWLPPAAIAAVSIILIAGHNGIDQVQPLPAQASFLWLVLHIPGTLRVSGTPVAFVLYPLVPWIAVMAIGYTVGPIFAHPYPSRPKLLAVTGWLMVILFLVLRFTNLYGDPSPWFPQPNTTAAIISFLQVTKYPPSLQYLLVTLGPAMILLGWFERFNGRPSRMLATIGRASFFFYIVHLYLIHLTAVAIGLWQGFNVRDLVVFFPHFPDDYGLSLPGVYLVWGATVAIMYSACSWFDGIKARHRNWWLKYL